MSQVLSLGLLHSMPLPQPGADSDKEQRGRVLAVAGSHKVPGAGLLAGVAALRAGAGKLQLAVPGSMAVAVGMALPEAGIIALDESEGHPTAVAVEQLLDPVSHADAVLLGPGLMDQETCAGMVCSLLTQRRNKFVLDAGALGGLWPNAETVRRQSGTVVITPHAGEMAALLGVSKAEIEAQPEAFAMQVAKRLNCVVALKGAITHIADGAGTIYANTAGSVGLGTSGSGDVLAGMISGFLARGASPLSAAMWGVYVHAKAGEQLEKQFGTLGFLAREIADAIPGVIRRLEAGAA